MLQGREIGVDGVALVTAIMMVAVFGLFRLDAAARKRWPKIEELPREFPLVLFPLVFAIQAAVMAGVANWWPSIKGDYLPRLFFSPWAGLAAVVSGFLLFLLRKRSLAVYGAVEVSLAFATLSATAFAHQASAFERAAALFGAMYFLIRGLDNLDKGEVFSQLSNYVEERSRDHGIYSSLFVSGAAIAYALVMIFWPRA